MYWGRFGLPGKFALGLGRRGVGGELSNPCAGVCLGCLVLELLVGQVLFRLPVLARSSWLPSSYLDFFAWCMRLSGFRWCACSQVVLSGRDYMLVERSCQIVLQCNKYL